MASFFRIGLVATGVAVVAGAGAIFWQLHNAKTSERKLAEDARSTRRRAEQGDAKAQYRLASMYQTGEGVRQDDGEAVRWLRKAADLGETMAQDGLGSMLYYGTGVPQDDVQAAQWFRKSADQGDAWAQGFLGSMYHDGKGVPQDDIQAIQWFAKAADQGDASAQYFLGYMYFSGQGVPQNYTEALRWYRKAADQGDVSAQIILAQMYRRGEGVPRNNFEAARWDGKLFALNFTRSSRGWISIGLIILAVLAFVLRKSRWKKARWLPYALVSVCGVDLANAVASARSWSFPVLFLVLIASASVLLAYFAFREAARKSEEANSP